MLDRRCGWRIELGERRLEPLQSGASKRSAATSAGADKRPNLSAPLLSLSGRLAGFPVVEQRGFQLAISRRPRLSRSHTRCRFPSFPFFFSGKLSFERGFLCRTFCCFLGCLLGRFLSLSCLLGGPALGDAGSLLRQPRLFGPPGAR